MDEARGAVGAAAAFDYGSTTVGLRLDYGMVALPPWSEESGAGRAAGRRIFHLSGRSRARSSTFTMFIPTTTTATPPCHQFVSVFLFVFVCVFVEEHALSTFALLMSMY